MSKARVRGLLADGKGFRRFANNTSFAVFRCVLKRNACSPNGRRAGDTGIAGNDQRSARAHESECGGLACFDPGKVSARGLNTRLHNNCTRT